MGAESDAASAGQYVVEDFQSGLPGIWHGNPDVRGGCEFDEKVSRGEKKSMRVSWDLIGSAGKRDNFVYFTENRPLAGSPVELRAWVWSDDQNVGSSVRMRLGDRSGETYIVAAKVEHSGWNELVFHLSGLPPAWESGDKNAVQDAPMILEAIGVGDEGTRGMLNIADVSVVTEGVASDLTLVEATADGENGIGWGKSPGLTLQVRNPSAEKISGLHTRIWIEDAITQKSIFEKRFENIECDPGGVVRLPVDASMPNGVFDLRWSTISQQGRDLPMGSGKLRIARMMGDVSQLARDEVQRTFAMKYGLLGGVFWLAPVRLAAQTGAHWERAGNTSLWVDLERSQGDFDLAPAIKRVDELEHEHLAPVYMNTVYNQPKFWQIDDPEFAIAYGRLHQRLAAALKGKCDWYEFGNEDNGPTKFAYTEIARHGAAAVREVLPYAMEMNSGTAQIDVNWLRLQKSRGLLDRLDMLVTHPYTWTASPEQYDLLGQFAQVDGVIDDLGGMKFQMSTEFGYPTEFDQQKRADWSPRHMAISTAAGLWRNGLYAFDNHYGIYDAGRPYPVAGTLNAFSCVTFLHRFAGWLRRDRDVWAAVFEKGGKPLVMSWAPEGDGQLIVETPVASWYDAFGNKETFDHPISRLKVTNSPMYILDAPLDMLAAARRDSISRQYLRYKRLLEKSSLRDNGDWASLAANPDAQFDVIAKVLSEWKPEGGEIQPSDQAVVAQAVRWLAETSRDMAKTGSADGSVDPSQRRSWQEILSASVRSDIDLPGLRWLLRFWEQIQDEAALDISLGNSSLADALLRMDPVFNGLCRIFAEKGPRVFFSIWPYLYSIDAKGKLQERCVFTPGKAVPVRVRVNSYSDKEYQGIVRLELPDGWTSQPSEWTGMIKPGFAQEIDFQVTASDRSSGGIKGVIQIPDMPRVVVPFNDFELLPSVGIEVPVLSDILPRIKLPLEIANNSSADLSAKLRVLPGSGLPALARASVTDVLPGEKTTVEVPLPKSLPVPAFNEWKLWAGLSTSRGKKLQVPLTVDFSACVQASPAPVVDGDLSDWTQAAPLHLNKPEYTHGSFGSSWTPEDLSGTVYTMWDREKVYVAVRVQDQLFNQNLVDSSVWQQDSVQLGFATVGGKFTGISLALTSKGPQVWNQSENRPVKDAVLAVKFGQDQAIYEVAIPWRELPGIQPAIGKKCRFDVLLNDDDAIVNRRFMERYGEGIVHEKGEPAFGDMNFIGPSTAANASGQMDNSLSTVFLEDFEEYPEGTSPDVWTVRSSGGASFVILRGKGRQASAGLVSGGAQGGSDSYSVITRPLDDLEVGKSYTLRAWVKGGSQGLDTSHLIGICSDQFSNEGYQDIPAWSASGEWQRVEWQFVAPGGKMNLYVRTLGDDGLIFDDITITPEKSL